VSQRAVGRHGSPKFHPMADPSIFFVDIHNAWPYKQCNIIASLRRGKPKEG